MIKLTLMLMFTLAMGVSAEETHLNNKFNDLVEKTYKDNPKRLDELIKCLLDKGPCEYLDSQIKADRGYMLSCPLCPSDKAETIQRLLGWIKQRDPKSAAELSRK